jgi:uncharacterized protein (TIGR00369 family)
MANEDIRQRIQASFDKQGLMKTLGAKIERVEEGIVEISLVPKSEIMQQHGFVHAGAVASIADSSAGYSALTLMPSGAGVLTAEFKINLIAPAKGDRLVARAKVVKAGRTLTIAQSEVFASQPDGSEKLIALLTATIMTIENREGVGD